MRASEVKLGGHYRAKVSGTLETIRIESTSPFKGWIAVNLRTGRCVRIRSAARLRYEVPKGEGVSA